MEGTATTTSALHRFSPFSISSHSNQSLCNKSPLMKTPFKSTNGFLSPSCQQRNERQETQFKPIRGFQELEEDSEAEFGGFPLTGLNYSRHSVVRLLRIEQGGAFADLPNDKGENSGENEMGYIERTLGFHTRDLDDRDIRLVTDFVGGAVRWRRYLDHLILSLCKD